MARILCIGDSITWGAFDLEMGGWVSRLRRELETEDIDDLENGRGVYNLGIGGDKIADALVRFDSEVKARDHYGIDTVIIALGINDSPHDTHPGGTDLETFQRQFRELVAKAETTKVRIIIVGLTNVDDDHPRVGNFKNEEVLPYAAIVEQVAKERGLSFIGLFGEIEKEELALDGIHPNAAGHEKIFRKVKEAIDASQP